MKIQVETVSPVEKKVVVEVDAERVARELDKAYVVLGRRVKLRGFRPGKVPRPVLEKNFREDVERDVVERLVNLAYGEAVTEHGVEAVSAPRVDVDEPGIQALQPFRFTARVEVKPAISPRDYKGLEVKRRPAAVTDAMVDEELQRLQEAMSKLVPVEGREEARDGDWALIDHDGTADGAPFEGARAEGVTIRVAAGDFFAGFMPQLAGHKVGETVEIAQAFPADFKVEGLRGKLARFQVSIRGLSTRNTPALDDAFAKGMAPGIDTLEQLRADLRRRIEQREKARERSEVHDGVVKSALAKNDFEVPPALVERAIDGMLEGAAQRFARQGIDMGQLGMDQARLRADLREQALLQVRGALLLEAVAEAEKIEPTEQDLDAEVARIAEENGIPLAQLQAQMRGAESRAALRNRVREDQVLAFLAGQAKIEDA
jgi:trigger factor